MAAKCDENKIKTNVLAIYELDSNDRKEPNDICSNISCEQNKIFMRNYKLFLNPDSCTSNNNIRDVNNIKETYYGLNCALPLIYSDFAHADQTVNIYINNNIYFVTCLDNLINNGLTYQEHKNQSKGVKTLYDRSNKLFKGLKHFLIPDQSCLDGDKIIKGTVLTLPYYNSTSTNIYKGCVYSINYTIEKPDDKGHLFIITPDDNTNCIDYISFVEFKRPDTTTSTLYHKLPQKSLLKQLLQENNLNVTQFSIADKYIYEQEVLFGRYTDIIINDFCGIINYIYNQAFDTLYEYTDFNNINIYTMIDLKINIDPFNITIYKINGLKKINGNIKDNIDPINDTSIILDDQGILKLKSGEILGKTTNYLGIGSNGLQNCINIFNSSNINSQKNLDPNEQLEKVLCHILGTKVYKCKLTNHNPEILRQLQLYEMTGGNKNNIILNEINDKSFFDSKNNVMDELLLNIEIIDNKETIDINSNIIYIYLQDFTLINNNYKHIILIEGSIISFNLYSKYINSLGIYIYFMIIKINLDNINNKIISNIESLLNELYNNYLKNNIFFYNINNDIHYMNNNKLYNIFKMQNKNKYLYLIKINHDLSKVDSSYKFNHEYITNKYKNKYNIVNNNKNNFIDLFNNLINKININLEINDNIYHQKYLKYKMKYLELKK